MRSSLRLFCCLTLTAVLVAPAAALAAEARPCLQPAAKLLLLRHASRLDDSDDSPLSAEGWAQAGRLVVEVGDEPISAIFVSTKRRTQQTAMPLAEYKGLKPQALSDTEQGAGQLLDRACGAARGAVLVYIGHTYTLSEIYAGLGLDDPKAGGAAVHEVTFRNGQARLRQR